MSETRSLLIWVLAGGAALALGAYLLQRSLVPSGEPAGASPEREAVESAAPVAAPPAPERRPIAVASAMPSPAPPASEPHAECQSDQDCIGPRHADCVRASCRDGQCTYDRSGCECTTSADCDDGDPCTRDHCFARTFECVFIPQDC